jgi:hypothetical protein
LQIQQQPWQLEPPLAPSPRVGALELDLFVFLHFFELIGSEILEVQEFREQVR